MDTKFSVALHILAMISESDKELSSQELALSVGTNASYIRKVISLLKKADLIGSHQGRLGYQLNKTPDKISLLAIYYATQEVDQIKLFQVHQNSNEHCLVGKNIEQAVSPIFDAVEKQLAAELSQKTLADVIANLHHHCRNA